MNRVCMSPKGAISRQRAQHDETGANGACVKKSGIDVDGTNVNSGLLTSVIVYIRFASCRQRKAFRRACETLAIQVDMDMPVHVFDGDARDYADDKLTYDEYFIKNGVAAFQVYGLDSPLAELLASSVIVDWHWPLSVRVPWQAAGACSPVKRPYSPCPTMQFVNGIDAKIAVVDTDGDAMLDDDDKPITRAPRKGECLIVSYAGASPLDKKTGKQSETQHESHNAAREDSYATNGRKPI